MPGRPPSSPLFPYPTLSGPPTFLRKAGDRRSPRATPWRRGRFSLNQVFEVLESRCANLLARGLRRDRKSTRLNSSHSQISYAVFCLKKKNTPQFAIAEACRG